MLKFVFSMSMCSSVVQIDFHFWCFNSNLCLASVVMAEVDLFRNTEVEHVASGNSLYYLVVYLVSRITDNKETSASLLTNHTVDLMEVKCYYMQASSPVCIVRCSWYLSSPFSNSFLWDVVTVKNHYMIYHLMA